MKAIGYLGKTLGGHMNVISICEGRAIRIYAIRLSPIGPSVVLRLSLPAEQDRWR